MKKIRCLALIAALAFYIAACGNNQSNSYNNSDTASANPGYNSSGTATGTGSDTTIGANPTDTTDSGATGHNRDTSHR